MSTSPRLYSIKELADLANMSTSGLRAWERRFGLLAPQRTPGGHRLYTDEDLQLLWHVRKLQNQGQDLKSIAELGRQALLGDARAHFAAVATPQQSERGLGAGNDIIQALEHDDLVTVRAVLHKLRLVATNAEVFVQQVYILWMQTHFAAQQSTISPLAFSSFSETLHTMFRWIAFGEGVSPQPERPVAVVANFRSTAGELSLLWTAALMRCWGYEVILVGSALSVPEIRRHVLLTNPRLLLVGGRWDDSRSWVREMGALVAPHCVTILSTAGTHNALPLLDAGAPEELTLLLAETIHEVQEISTQRATDTRPAAIFVESMTSTLMRQRPI